MASVSSVERRRVAIGCASCGAVAYVYLTVTTLAATPTCLHLRVVPDADDLVMVELMREAHRGPLVRR